MSKTPSFLCHLLSVISSVFLHRVFLRITGMCLLRLVIAKGSDETVELAYQLCCVDIVFLLNDTEFSSFSLVD